MTLVGPLLATAGEGDTDLPLGAVRESTRTDPITRGRQVAERVGLLGPAASPLRGALRASNSAVLPNCRTLLSIVRGFESPSSLGQ